MILKWILSREMKKVFGFSPEEVLKWKEILFLKDDCNAQEALRFMIKENNNLKEERDIALNTLRGTITEHNQCRESLRDLKETISFIQGLSHPTLEDVEYRKAYEEIIDAANRAMQHTDIM